MIDGIIMFTLLCGLDTLMGREFSSRRIIANIIIVIFFKLLSYVLGDY